jgi:hypothetical protein
MLFLCPIQGILLVKYVKLFFFLHVNVDEPLNGRKLERFIIHVSFELM